MKALLLSAAAFAAGAPAASAATQTVRLEDLAARVVVMPEARSDVKVEIRPGASDIAAPRLFWEGGRAVVRGTLDDGDLKNCRKSGKDFDTGNIVLHGRRNVAVKDLPVVVLHTPQDVVIEADGAVVGEVGAARSVTLSHERCGAWKFADVSGRLDLDIEGVADIYATRAGAAIVKLEGMGDVHLVSVGAFTADLEGMADITVDRVNGPVDVSLEGMGDVRIKSGNATTFKAALEGMGDVQFDGVAASLDASADGMGTIRVAQVTGAKRTSQSGFAKVKIGR
ncbi:hypothetical protein [Caulobacter sp. 17J80-11]|uniref:hypothetical protein n=1 Tax=Caulobacter sp. 17J80-11 TaxID=2763502 RepID=UPI0016535633|nr:hypothetical protein [Caulobacter sp. 17J80-11]MBC6980615.1 hypothetical protein [Caulobacter sp. 17J80-11]